MRTTTFLLLAALTVFAVGCKKKTDSTSGDSTPAPQHKGEAAGDDMAFAQGNWEVSKVDLGEPGGPPAQDQRKIRLTINSNRVAATVGDEDWKHYGVFSLDTTQSPKWFDVTEADAKCSTAPTRGRSTQPGGGEVVIKRRTFKGIYKVEGDQLVLAVGPSNGARPTNFRITPEKPGTPQPENEPSFVLYLKKK